MTYIVGTHLKLKPHLVAAIESVFGRTFVRNTCRVIKVNFIGPDKQPRYRVSLNVEGDYFEYTVTQSEVSSLIKNEPEMDDV